jgi:hypothetical protein
MRTFSRREALKLSLACSVGWGTACRPTDSGTEAETPDFARIASGTFAFLLRCRRDDGGYRASPDPDYLGHSDTRASDLAAVTYAATLAKTMDRELPSPEQSADYIRRRQRGDGSFANQSGAFDPDDELAVLYNTTQGVVALRALGALPDRDPEPVMDRFFADERFRTLPLYTTSFFPLFYAALGRPYPKEFKGAVLEFMISMQAEDGYLQDHVAATFHMAHYCRLIGVPTPRAEAMVERTLDDQTPEGGWNIKEPDWDVHACFDALFILRQLGTGTARCRQAIARSVSWALSCRNSDGGFGHFPGYPSDVDAVYFVFGSLIQAEVIPGTRFDLPDAHTLGWGHAMQPDRIYV